MRASSTQPPAACAPTAYRTFPTPTRTEATRSPHHRAAPRSRSPVSPSADRPSRRPRSSATRSASAARVHRSAKHQKQQLIAFAECMRRHGLKQWADPTFPPSGGIMQGGGPYNRDDPKVDGCRHGLQQASSSAGQLRDPAAQEAPLRLRWRQRERALVLGPAPRASRRGAAAGRRGWRGAGDTRRARPAGRARRPARAPRRGLRPSPPPPPGSARRPARAAPARAVRRGRASEPSRSRLARGRAAISAWSAVGTAAGQRASSRERALEHQVTHGENALGLRDLIAVPAAAVLVLERDQLAVRVRRARRGASAAAASAPAAPSASGSSGISRRSSRARRIASSQSPARISSSPEEAE